MAYAAEFFRWYAEEAVRNIGEISSAPASGARIVVQHKPAGIAVLVTPWNFPAAMATRKIGPALAAGCPVVLKPASDTPLTMLALMPALEEAGVPAGVVNVIPSRSSGKVVGAMLHDPRVRVVSFTGSTEVGRKLLHEAADNIVKPAMELGGNAPFIVFEDADIDAAIDGAMIAKMRNMGEACTAANRFYVHEKVHDEFAKKLTAKMSWLKMGNGLDDGVNLGPLVNKDGRDKVIELVDDAVKKGAKVLTGGKLPDGPGFFYPATVLTNVPRLGKDAERGNFRAGCVDPDLQDRGRGDQARQRHRIRPGRLSLHKGSEPRHAGVGETRLRHDRPQSRPRLRSGGAVRRHQAVRPRPRRRAGGHEGISRDAICVGELVAAGQQNSEGKHVDVLMPQLGETVAEGKITKWFKAAGDAVKPGDNLFEIETDKTSMEVPSTTSGTLTEIRFKVGDVGQGRRRGRGDCEAPQVTPKLPSGGQPPLTPAKAGVQARSCTGSPLSRG